MFLVSSLRFGDLERSEILFDTLTIDMFSTQGLIWKLFKITSPACSAYLPIKGVLVATRERIPLF